jgi:anti-anti-sigma regulatory factor
MEGDRVYADKQLVILRGESRAALTIAGSIDHLNANAVTRALTNEIDGDREAGQEPPQATAGNGDLRVDLSRLEFCDVSGIRAIVGVAKNAPGGRRLVLSGLPPRIASVMSVVGWVDLPNIVIEGT